MRFLFTNRMTRPAKYNYWKAFLVFSQFSSVSMVYIQKKEVNETNKRVGYASDRKSSLLTLKWVVLSNRTACILVFYKAKFGVFLLCWLVSFFCVRLCRFTLRFLSCIAFSVYEVVLVDCLSLSWFVYAQLRLKQATRTTSYTLKAMQKRNLCS